MDATELAGFVDSWPLFFGSHESCSAKHAAVGERGRFYFSLEAMSGELEMPEKPLLSSPNRVRSRGYSSILFFMITVF